MGSGKKDVLEKQFRRQALWLRESLLWIAKTKILMAYDSSLPRGLDVGCGPGFVMDIMREVMDVRGVDFDPDMVKACESRELDVVQGLAENLPFEDDEFDVVYCTFLLLWVNDPVKVISEMKRVSREWVLCLAEPDYGGRVDHPDGLDRIRKLFTQSLISEGADPQIGRKLRDYFSECGMNAEIGVHAGVWDVEKLKQEFPDEWRHFEMTVGKNFDEDELERVKEIWKKALDEGKLFQFNPIFYALGRK
jgi:SAM-dependent methyltransferase